MLGKLSVLGRPTNLVNSRARASKSSYSVDQSGFNAFDFSIRILYCNVTSYVPILGRHGALYRSRGIISLPEKNIFPRETRENTNFISLKNIENSIILPFYHLDMTDTY